MKPIAIMALAALLTPLVHAQTATATVGTPFTTQLAPGSNFGYQLTVNGAAPTTFAGNSITFAGLAYDNSTGILSGTPTTAGTFAINLQQSTATFGQENQTKLTLTVNASGTTPPPPPPPNALFCATGTPQCGAVLTWDAPGPPAPAVPATATTPAIPAQLAAAGYLIFRGIQGGATPTQLTPAALPLAQLTYTDKTIAASTTYEYYLVSVDSTGVQGAASNTVTVSVASKPSVATPPTPPPPTNATGLVSN